MDRFLKRSFSKLTGTTTTLYASEIINRSRSKSNDISILAIQEREGFHKRVHSVSSFVLFVFSC